MTNNLNNHKSKYFLIYYIGAAIIGVGIIHLAYTTVQKSFTSPSKYIESSNAHRASGNYKAALDALNTAIKLDSKNPQLYIERAEVRDKLGDELGFIEDIKKAIQIDPNNKGSYLLNFTSWNGDSNARLKRYNQAIQIDPNNYQLYLGRGELRHYSLNDNDKKEL